jgi:hypothetical protein
VIHNADFAVGLPVQALRKLVRYRLQVRFDVVAPAVERHTARYIQFELLDLYLRHQQPGLGGGFSAGLLFNFHILDPA